jgi:SAM-dependent methyltransferase
MATHLHFPWQLKIAAKLVLARVPFRSPLFKHVGVFTMGGMDHPEYAMGVFRRHFDGATFARKAQPFVALELGPGDSLFSALIARTFGAITTFAVDVGPFAISDVGHYRQMESHLRRLGLQPPSLANCSTVSDIMKLCGGKYLTSGLASLKEIPSGSVDFVWSHAVLQHVRRKEFLPLLQELRRIQRPDGVGSHCLSISDILGGRLNDLRFSERVWESELMANSGFYTNRIRYGMLLEMFRQAGFDPRVYRTAKWQTLPTPRDKMAPEFANLPEEDLQISGFDVYLR